MLAAKAISLSPSDSPADRAAFAGEREARALELVRVERVMRVLAVEDDADGGVHQVRIADCAARRRSRGWRARGRGSSGDARRLVPRRRLRRVGAAAATAVASRGVHRASSACGPECAWLRRRAASGAASASRVARGLERLQARFERGSAA
jgi:hypothetical protein